MCTTLATTTDEATTAPTTIDVVSTILRRLERFARFVSGSARADGSLQILWRGDPAAQIEQ